ncbi:MAG TPA: hypothetical protein VMW24_06600, partial [Sedimentisphaerales bacterium]|nr:hypothetical protein [Sedimentisphaerales bacterium]
PMKAEEFVKKVQKTKLAEDKMIKSGGPYIGPRGGKWADPAHTIPWEESITPHAVRQHMQQMDLGGKHGKEQPAIYRQVKDEPHVKVTVPLDQVDAIEPNDKKRVQNYAGRNSPIPAVRGKHGALARRRGSKQIFIQDGNHRVAAARERGDTHIEVMMSAEDWKRFHGSAPIEKSLVWCEDLSKAAGHKYIERHKLPSGKWAYRYAETEQAPEHETGTRHSDADMTHAKEVGELPSSLHRALWVLDRQKKIVLIGGQETAEIKTDDNASGSRQTFHEVSALDLRKLWRLGLVSAQKHGDVTLLSMTNSGRLALAYQAESWTWKTKGERRGYKTAEPQYPQLSKSIEVEDDLFKAAGHKYVKRIPTGKAKPRYRYFYSSPKTKQITSSDDIIVGSKFKASHGGKVGHFEVTGHDSKTGIVTVKHDESGKTAHVRERDLHKLVESFHRKTTTEAVKGDKPAGLPRATMADLAAGTWDGIEGFSMSVAELESQAAAGKGKSYAIIKQPTGFVLVSKSTAPAKAVRELRGDVTAVKMRAASGIDTMRASYVLVEASDIIASHKPTGNFSKHPGYPDGVQERRYHEVQAEQDKVDRIAKHLDPAILVNSNPDGVNGAPIVTSKNIVLGGNGRTMAMQRAYEEYPESAKALKDYLEKNAKAFGMKAADVAAMKQPVLVRKMRAKDTGDTAKMKLLGRRMNESLTQGLDPRSEEVAVSQFVTRDVTDSLVSSIDQDQTVGDFLASKKSADFVKTLRRAGIVDEFNKAKYLDKETGLLNEDGRLRVERVLVAKFIPDASLLDRMAPTLRQVIAKSTPSLLISQEAGWDIGKDLQTAVKADLFIRTQYSGQPSSKALNAFLSQPDLAGMGSSLHSEITSNPIAHQLLVVIREHLGKEKTPKALRGFAVRAKQAEHAGGGFAFASEGVVTDPAEALDIEFGISPQRAEEKQARDKEARDKAKALKVAEKEQSRITQIQAKEDKKQGGLFGDGQEDMAASTGEPDLVKAISRNKLLDRVLVHTQMAVDASRGSINRAKVIAQVLDDVLWAVNADPEMRAALKRSPVNSKVVGDLVDAHIAMASTPKPEGLSKSSSGPLSGVGYTGPAPIGRVVSGGMKVDGTKSAARHVIDVTAVMNMIEETIQNNKRKSRLVIDLHRFQKLESNLFEVLQAPQSRPKQFGDWVLPYADAHPEMEDNRRQTDQQGEKAVKGQKTARESMRFTQVKR